MSKEQNLPLSEEDDEIQQAVHAAKQTLRLATRDIAKRGLLIKSEDWDGEPVQKLNPSVALQKQAIQVIIALRNLELQKRKRFDKSKKENKSE